MQPPIMQEHYEAEEYMECSACGKEFTGWNALEKHQLQTGHQ